MKIARWEKDGAVGEGVVVEDQVIPFGNGATVADVLGEGLAAALVRAEALDQAQGVPLDSVRLLAPLVPTTIRDFVAFEEHVEGMAARRGGSVAPEWYDLPTFYFTNPLSLLGPGDTVTPPATQRLDYELEIGIVVGALPGSDGANLDAGTAARSIFGYTIFNDWSARDVQGREMNVHLGPCKGKDFGTSIGPWIVTADEFEDLIDPDGFLALHLEVEVNGTLVGEDLLSNMGWPIPELVAYASRNTRVVPGDLLGSGTAGNGGCLAELWGLGRDIPSLQEGDEVVMRAERIGELRGRVGAPVSVPPIPRARVRDRARTR
jgi:2-keto-4-pentenoate hydratase/2-oxohepta-3-ene-1,7-dioic acid hydratase in catechol pathway